ncbi:hypothetical protein MPER_07229, partial [Moniliophthora perniciosa FA553]
MGQSYSKQSPPSPQKGIAGFASGGFKLKRAFAARRKKSEDATKFFASGSQQLGPSDGPGPSSQVAAAAPLKVTAPSLPPKKRNKLTIVTQVLTGGSKSQSPASPLPPPPPPKPVSLQDVKQSPKTLSKPFHTISEDHRGSIIPVTPAISSAVTFMRMGEEQREHELPKPEARSKEKDSEKKEERSGRDQAGEATDKELKQLWRKSDSTMSHHTIRPGAAAGNRTSRPVSMAESLRV